MDKMTRYTMAASNGSVVHHESTDGMWVRWDDADYELSTLRYENEEVTDKIKEMEGHIAGLKLIEADMQEEYNSLSERFEASEAEVVAGQEKIAELEADLKHNAATHPAVIEAFK